MAQEKRAITILWRIENFSLYKHKIWEDSISTKIALRTFDGNTCDLGLYVEDDELARPHNKLILELNGWETLNYKIDIEMAYLDSDEVTVFSETLRNEAFFRLSSLSIYGPTWRDVFKTNKTSFLPDDTLTLRCRIWKSEGEFEDAENLYLYSQITSSEREHFELWPINEFSKLSLYEDVTKNLKLPSFKSEACVLFRLSLIGDSLIDSMIDCTIYTNYDANKVTRAKLCVLDSDLMIISYNETRKIQDGCTLIVPELVYRKALMSRDPPCLTSDILNVLCVLTYTKITHTMLTKNSYFGSRNLQTFPLKVISDSEGSGPNPVPNTTSKSTSSEERDEFLVILREDLMSLYRESRLSDFELRSGEVSFPVHKVILSARSPVFRDMFSSDMKEPDTDFLDVSDVSVNTLNQMLVFLYTGTVEPLEWEGAVKLYYAADKFQVHSIKQHCSSLIRSEVTVSNVCELLVQADRHRDKELKVFAQDFILRNYDEVIPSDKWEEFLENDPLLAGKTMQRLYKKKLEIKNKESGGQCDSEQQADGLSRVRKRIETTTLV